MPVPCVPPTEAEAERPRYMIQAEPITKGGGLCSDQSLRWDPQQQPIVRDSESAPSSSLPFLLKLHRCFLLEGDSHAFCMAVRRSGGGCE